MERVPREELCLIHPRARGCGRFVLFRVAARFAGTAGWSAVLFARVARGAVLLQRVFLRGRATFQGIYRHNWQN